MIGLAQVQRRLLSDSDGDGDGWALGTRARRPSLDPAQVLGLARDAGLTGRGGAGFPLWRKLAAVAAAGRPAEVIANAAEGEPASGKDRALLTYQPNLIFDGLQLAAQATGARAAHLYGPRDALPGLRQLLDARRGAGLDPVVVRLHAAPDAFVAGEESAVVAAVRGRAAVPADKRVRITEAGFLVQNVETLAHLAMIARHGPGWFRAAGTPDEPGTFLATVSGAVVAPGVVEAGYGVSLGELIAAAGGASGDLQAVLIGGYHGGWAPADPALPVSRAALAPFGAAPGAGVVIALGRGECGLVATARIAGYLAGQSAGQCGPCVNGLPRLASTLTLLSEQPARAGLAVSADPGARPGLPGSAGHPAGPGLVAEVDRLARLVTGRGACRHPDGTARLILSAMRAFESDVTAHLAGRCVAEGHR